MSRKNIISVLCLTICGLLPLKSEAEVRLSPLFGDGMVLQQRSSVPIFGSAVRGETVIVKTGWDGREYSTSADETGRFITYVKTPEAGGPYSLTINGRTVLNVMSGEVWLCSGQSNMQFTLAASDMSEVNGECLDNVRIFTVPIQSRREPVAELTSGRWHFGDVDSIKTKVSAVAYYFARSLHAETGVPVGIISSSRGATAAEEWMSGDMFNSMPESVRKAYSPPSDRFPGCWYNAMIAPLLPYRIAGVLWYQGENNASRRNTYFPLMKGLIGQWRDGFGDKKLPFYIVELAPFSNNWAEFREIQQSIADEVPDCGFVSIIDAGDSTNIHPRNKFPVGKRLADMAASRIYGKDTRPAPPRFRCAHVKKGKLEVRFSNPGDSLVLSHGSGPGFFEIAGPDGAFSPAHARIQGKSVIVWSEDVPKPRYVRYFFGRYYSPNLFSSDGYPVAPFRMKQRRVHPKHVVDKPFYESPGMPAASGLNWKPFGINSADTRLSSSPDGLEIATGKSVFGYESLLSDNVSDTTELLFSAMARRGGMVVDYCNGSSRQVCIGVYPDCIIDECTGDTLALGMNNSLVSDYLVRLSDSDTYLFKDGSLVCRVGQGPDRSFTEKFETCILNSRSIRCSPWSRVSCMDDGIEGKSLLWRNGTTGQMVVELRVKPNSDYTLSFDALIPPKSPDKAMKATLSTKKRRLQDITVTGEKSSKYIVPFSTSQEEHLVRLVFHNGYYTKKPCFLCIDNLQLSETSSIPYLQFGCFSEKPSDVVIKSIELK